MITDVLKKVAAPGAEFRGAPFWAWNAKLSEDELRRQIRFMKSMGLGGFFMHSRVGLNTAYLGKEWFSCVRACLDEARKNDMIPWLYDEDRYPSGDCGGEVTKNMDYRQRWIDVMAFATPADVTPLEKGDQLLAVFSAEVDGNHARNLRREEQLPASWEAGRSMLVFYRRISADNSWYNGQAYLDTMNKEAVQCFIRNTHEAYYREIGDEFGTFVPGIFTDEPNYIDDIHGQGAAWTETLRDEFRRRYGYDIVDHLPEIFYFIDDEDFSRARLDYRNLCTTLFTEAFARQIGEWCGAHNFKMTGHVLWEDDVILQTSCSGSDMRFYQYMQAPGIDVLTEHWTNFVTAKQCSSVAHQFGRETRLSETYGCTGWDFPFAGHKALGDWQYALGINFRCQHLAWYSMEAEAKRDYPASISYQSPWYKDFPMVEDYFARLGAALSEGEEQRRLLVIHPIESTFAWTPVARTFPLPDWTKDESEYLVRVTWQLLAASLDFDFGDEELLASYGSVADGALKMNLASYRAVLIPRLRTIRRTTLTLLRDFAAAGGLVGYYGCPPKYVDGKPSEEAADVYRAFRALAPEQLSEVFSPSARLVSFTGRDGQEISPLIHIMRASDDHMTLFVCNFSTPFQDDQWTYPMVRDRKLEFPYVKVKVKAKPGLKVFELNLLEGGISAVSSEFADGWIVFETSFAALGSRLFFLTAENIATRKAVQSGGSAVAATVRALDGAWTVTPDDFNVVVLDQARYSVDGGDESGPANFLQIDDDLRANHLKVACRGWAMVQPWLSLSRKPEKELDLKLTYDFACDVVPSSDCYLALERPEYYDIAVNGRALSKEDCGFWVDICLRRLRIPADFLKAGENRITLVCRYHELLPGLESAFLLGCFGVRPDGRTIIGQPATLRAGDWVEQGYCNYAGNMKYQQTFLHVEKQGKRVFLDLPGWAGTALEIRLNGGVPHRLPWPPYSVDVTSDIKDGLNVLEITVVGHRRNAFGPFYLNTKWPDWSGPEQFKTFEVDFRQLVPCGILTAPVLREEDGNI